MTPETQNATLSSLLLKFRISYVTIENSESIDKIYNLFVNDDTIILCLR